MLVKENRDKLAVKYIRLLEQVQTSYGDAEDAHFDADCILTDLLIDLGFKDVVDEWEKVPKWYA